jgi:tetratricopeptide (TPR) repeat protein
LPEPPDAESLAALAERWNRDKTSRLFLQLAEELRRAGRSAAAIEVLEDGLRHHPDSVAGLVAMARCRLDLGEDRAAVEVLERALERDPAQLVANKLLTEAWIRLGEAGPARERLATYRLVNERDDEIEELEARIAALARPPGAGAAGGPRRGEGRVFDLRPLGERPLPMLDELQPLPAREERSWAPFPALHDRRRAERRIEDRFAAEGIFTGLARFRPAAAIAAVEVEPAEPEIAPAAAPPAAEPAPLFSLHSLGDEVEREAVPEAAAAAAESRTASATLASLYLQQGHLDEAETEYRAVLAARPGDRFARSGIERIAQLRRAVAGAGSRASRGGLTQRKIEALRGWLESLRRERRSRG